MRLPLAVLAVLAVLGSAGAFSLAPTASPLAALGRGRALGLASRRESAPLGPSMLVGVPKVVLVTGATGRTGFATFKLMKEMEKDFVVQGLVRSEKAGRMLEKLGASFGDSEKIRAQNEKLRKLGMPTDDEQPDIFIGDIVDKSTLAPALKDCDALVICTSGVPKLRKRELAKSILSKLVGRQRLPKFYFEQMPEEVDWEGCKNQIDAAKEAGVGHVVLVSSMGVTPAKNTNENILNKMGGGNILVWKAKAEEYLKESGLDYTIIHPGGLINKPGGEREIVLGVNDELLDGYEARGATRAIPREDVSRLVAAAVKCKDLVKNKSFDCVSKAPGEGRVTQIDDFQTLFMQLP
eukprot:CAMPEP_0206214070 /NCGR_PEP_ID=MMETSP0047_2-20121206/1467_1 /ASSEMBLY_ACC=CAM_ASM_000192 /TAXON_ID=195065 /ORGANISM="Chroomonas mesostigmatica_cf, Strain CCMP1168" /LENGTH=350 /DNA_ID=CAMNT_0053636277 /DNA_START=24 /DNA_END=1076 /DNA_ORIENTATION=+